MNQTTQDTSSDIRQILSNHLKCSKEDLEADTVISTLPNVDSMRLLEIIIEVEKTYEIEIPDSAPFNVKTIGEFESLISSLISPSQKISSVR